MIHYYIDSNIIVFIINVIIVIIVNIITTSTVLNLLIIYAKTLPATEQNNENIEQMQIIRSVRYSELLDVHSEHRCIFKMQVNSAVVVLKGVLTVMNIPAECVRFCYTCEQMFSV